jgi:putative membrane protein
VSTPALSRAEAGARHRLGSLAVAVGFAVLACVWLGPLPELAASTFTAHMTMHVAVVCVAAPILASGLAGTRYDRVDMHPLLFSPLTASLAELVVVWGWHTPVLHAVAREHEFGLMTEQASFRCSADRALDGAGERASGCSGCC